MRKYYSVERKSRFPVGGDLKMKYNIVYKTSLGAKNYKVIEQQTAERLSNMVKLLEGCEYVIVRIIPAEEEKK